MSNGDDYAQQRLRRPDWFIDPSDAFIRFRTSPPQGSVAYADSYITVIVDEVMFGDATPGRYVRIMPASNRTDGVAILPVCGDEVLLVRQFRHSVRGWRLEIPRGFGEPGLDPIVNAQRELVEETGYHAAAVTYLGILEQDTGLLGMRTHLFLASIEAEAIQGHVEDGISVMRVGKSDMKCMIMTGEITDAFTIACWTRASALL